MHTMYNQRQSGDQLGQWRMFFVHPQIEFLQIADTSADMSNFIEGH